MATTTSGRMNATTTTTKKDAGGSSASSNSEDVEDCALRTVESIRDAIDRLRAHFSSGPPPPTVAANNRNNKSITKAGAAVSSIGRKKKESISASAGAVFPPELYAYAEVREMRRVVAVMVQQQQAQQVAATTTTTTETEEEESISTTITPTFTGARTAAVRATTAINIPKDDGAENETELDERFRVVHGILLPLLECLGECYAVLDRLVAESESETSSSRQRQQQQQKKSAGDRNSGGKPVPPVGMLSLQNYTDVAALLEFTVCSSLLPLLDLPANAAAFADAEHRARSLPRAIAGRLPRQSLLLWNNRTNTATNTSTTTHDGSSASVAGATTASGSSTAGTIEELHRTVAVVGRVLLLDRFRPMLLPRHLADLYAAAFRCRHLQQLQQQQQEESTSATTTAINVDDSSSSQQLQHDFDRILSQLLPHSYVGKESPRPGDGTVVVIDAALQARALQFLLSQGLSTPGWLRRSASDQLSRLAATDLSALMTVFVDPRDDTSAGTSCLRLARTLVLPAAGSKRKQQQEAEYFRNALGRQVVELLDGIAAAAAAVAASQQTTTQPQEVLSTTAATTTGPAFTRQQVAHVHAAWALLDALPQSSWERHMLNYATGGGTTNDEHNTPPKEQLSIALLRRWSLLLSLAPPFACTEKLCRLALLTPKEEHQQQPASERCSLLARILRWASDHQQSRVLHSMLRQEAIQTLRWLSQTVIHTEFKKSNTAATNTAGSASKEKDTPTTKVPGYEVLAVAFVYALAPCCGEADGSDDNGAPSDDKETPSAGGEGGRASMAGSGDENVLGELNSMSSLVNEIEDRAKVLTKDVLHELLLQETPNNESDERGKAPVPVRGDREQCLASAIFLFLLETYLDPCVDDVSLRLVSMVTLPLLCEACPPEALLQIGCSSENAGGASSTSGSLFGMMKLLFESTIRLRGDPLAKTAALEQALSSRNSEITGMLGLRSVARYDRTSLSSSTDTLVDEELLLSLCSLLLSLLVGVLELGSDHRSAEEEACLQSFTGTLRPLASASVEDARGDNHVPCELAQMAGHAMALLAARSAPPRIVEAAKASVGKEDGQVETIPDILAEVEQDLRSAEAPLRARAVVTLRHLASSYDNRESGGTPSRKVPNLLPNLLDDIESNVSSDDDFLWRMLRIAVQALSDSESYVYLAAVQTIATIADVKPQKTISSIGLALSCGELRCGDGANVTLLPSQRTKLAEALIWVIRRKATIQEDYLSSLLDIMIFEENGRAVEGRRSSVDDKLIQKQTHEYFIRGHGQNEVSDEFMSEDEKWEVINTRVSAGGPLFESEEEDVVRAAKISVVSELVAAADPAIIARHCSVLVHCSTVSVRLDASRPVRRAGSLLARSVYEALVREQDLMAAPNEADSRVRLAVAMVDAREDVLAVALERCVEVDDLDDLGSQKRRLYDPATVARCQEALALRKEADEGGILALGQLMHDAESRQEGNPIFHTLLEPSRKEESLPSVAKRIIEEL